MYRLVPLFAALLIGCQGQDLKEMQDLRSELRSAQYKIDSLSNSFRYYRNALKTPEYYWFDLSTKGFSRVADFFYITAVKTKFQPNGVTVSGVIGNLEAMSKTNIEITAAVQDSLYNVISGQGEIGFLGAGDKTNFSVFIPTQEKSVQYIGFKFGSYRM